MLIQTLKNTHIVSLSTCALIAGISWYAQTNLLYMPIFVGVVSFIWFFLSFTKTYRSWKESFVYLYFLDAAACIGLFFWAGSIFLAYQLYNHALFYDQWLKKPFNTQGTILSIEQRPNQRLS